MSAWTEWRKMADRRYWYDDALDWDGAACYELSIAGPRGEGHQIVYVGETGNENRRVVAYASNGSHLAQIIDWHLKRGWHLFYRAQLKRSKREAVRMQCSLLARFDNDWNIQLNGQ